MEEQLQNINRELTKLHIHILAYGRLVDFEVINFRRILSTKIDDKLIRFIDRYMILEEERSFLEYMLTKTD